MSSGSVEGGGGYSRYRMEGKREGVRERGGGGGKGGQAREEREKEKEK